MATAASKFGNNYHINACADLKKPRVEITSFAYWQDEFDEPDKQFNPDFFRNVLADGIDVTIEDQMSG